VENLSIIPLPSCIRP